MKHIQKKYLFQVEKSKTNIASVGKEISFNDSDVLKKSKNHDVYLHTNEDIIIKSLAYNYNGKLAFIPIPDLTLVYFDAAYNYNSFRKNEEKKLFSKAISTKIYDEDLTNEVYRYYGYASTSIISLFTALESFINHLLPENKDYVIKKNNKTEVYSKEQIQKSIPFDEKIKHVLPFFYSKDFYSKPTKHNQLLSNLKELRDDIIHTKSDQQFSNQEILIRKVLKFNFDESFDSVAFFMNFYKTDYITECKCGIDY